MRHFRVVRMGIVNRVVFAHAHIGGVRFGNLENTPLSKNALLSFPISNKIIEPRIGTSGKKGRVAQFDDVIVRTDRKAFQLAQLGQFSAQCVSKEHSAFVVRVEVFTKNSRHNLSCFYFYF